MPLPWFLPNIDKKHIESLDPGLRLFRVHASLRSWDYANSQKPRLRIGGRFDCHEGSPSAWYVSTTREGALSEALFRSDGLGIDDPLVRTADLSGLTITEVEVVKAVDVVALAGGAFQHMRIPPSVTTTLSPYDYAISRQAADDIRASTVLGTASPLAIKGLRWRCARNTNLSSVVLWLDDGTRWVKLTDHVAPVDAVPLLDDLPLVRDLAAEYGYTIVT
jgi:hypothetical protein